MKSSKAHDPARFDVAAFAADAGRLAGEWPGTRLARLTLSQSPPQDVAPAAVSWQVTGEVRPVLGTEPEVWLRVQARTAASPQANRIRHPTDFRKASEAKTGSAGFHLISTGMAFIIGKCLTIASLGRTSEPHEGLAEGRAQSRGPAGQAVA